MNAHVVMSASQKRLERKILHEETVKEMRKVVYSIEEDEIACAMFVLHNEFGFGRDRLRKYFDEYASLHKQLDEMYGSGKEYDFDGWYAKRELKKIGVDVHEWYEEA